jgi:PHD/YefM family antitoxin component YafN of YafNO toxin-antitoxin module
LKLIPSAHSTAQEKHNQSKKEKKTTHSPIVQTSPRRYPLKKQESEKEDKETDFFHSF